MVNIDLLLENIAQIVKSINKELMLFSTLDLHFQRLIQKQCCSIAMKSSKPKTTCSFRAI